MKFKNKKKIFFCYYYGFMELFFDRLIGTQFYHNHEFRQIHTDQGKRIDK